MAAARPCLGYAVKVNRSFRSSIGHRCLPTQRLLPNMSQRRMQSTALRASLNESSGRYSSKYSSPILAQFRLTFAAVVFLFRTSSFGLCESSTVTFFSGLFLWSRELEKPFDMFDADHGFKLATFKTNTDEDRVGIVRENSIWWVLVIKTIVELLSNTHSFCFQNNLELLLPV